MINIIVDTKYQVIRINEEPIITLLAIQEPVELLNTFNKILVQAFYSGETISLEYRDKIGATKEINRFHRP